MLIGLSGTFGSGKDTVAKLFESKGFEHFSTADILREEALKLGRTIERDSLRVTANELRQKYGSGYLAEKAIERATKKNVLISAIRSKGEIDLVKSQPDSKIVFVDAPIELRYERIFKRKRHLEDETTLEEFKKSEAAELKGDSNSQFISYCRDNADVILENSATVAELQKKVDELVAKLMEDEEQR